MTEIVEGHSIVLRERLTLRTVAGDTFSIVKPFIREGLLAQMRELAREILDGR